MKLYRSKECSSISAFPGLRWVITTAIHVTYGGVIPDIVFGFTSRCRRLQKWCNFCWGKCRSSSLENFACRGHHGCSACVLPWACREDEHVMMRKGRGKMNLCAADIIFGCGPTFLWTWTWNNMTFYDGFDVWMGLILRCICAVWMYFLRYFFKTCLVRLFYEIKTDFCPWTCDFDSSLPMILMIVSALNKYKTF